MKVPQDNPILAAIADDHEMMRGGICTFVERLRGVKFIIQADNGKDLVAQLRANPILPEICLVDIQMPEMNGFETVEAIKAEWPEMNILVISSFLDDWHVEKMIILGANGYLYKSSSPAEVKKAMITICKYGMYFNDFFSKTRVLPRGNQQAKLPNLTEKELQVLKFSDREMTWAEIALELNTSQKSVEGHRDSMYRKLGVKTKAGLALCAVQLGVLQISSSGIPII